MDTRKAYVVMHQDFNSINADQCSIFWDKEIADSYGSGTYEGKHRVLEVDVTTSSATPEPTTPEEEHAPEATSEETPEETPTE